MDEDENEEGQGEEKKEGEEWREREKGDDRGESVSPSKRHRRYTHLVKIVPVRTPRYDWSDVQTLKTQGISPDQAVRENRTEELEALLTDDPSVLDQADKDGMTLVHKAAQYNTMACLRVLIKHQAKLEVKAADDATPLHKAARADAAEVGRVLVAQGVKVNCQMKTGHTPLHVAASHGCNRIRKVLLSRPDIDLEARDTNQLTPLMVASHHGHKSFVKQLLAAGADVFARSSSQSTAFLMAASESDPEMMDLLLSGGTKQKEKEGEQRLLTDQDIEGNSCLQVAIINNKLQNAEYLLKKGVNAATQNAVGKTALHQAALHGNAEMTSLLLEHGCPISTKDKDGNTAFHVATAFNRVSVMEVLTKMGADINAKNGELRTPLLDACARGRREAVDFLISNGAQVAEVDASLRTAFHLAVAHNHYDILILLLSLMDSSAVSSKSAQHAGSVMLEMADSDEQTPAHLAAASGNVQILKTLIAHKCRLDAKDLNSSTPLHVAASQNRHEALEVLLKSSRSELQDADINGRTPLLLAAANGQVACVQTLLDFGADITSTDMQRNTALMLASMGGHVKVMDLLVKVDADMEATDQDLNTALHIACRYDRHEAAQRLLRGGASVVARNKRGFSPLQVAAMYQQTEAAKVLLLHDSWRSSMSVRDKDGRTPMDLLTENVPEAAMIVLDYGIQTTGAKYDEDYTIHYDFEFLDPGPDDPASKKERYNGLKKMVSAKQEDLLSHSLCQMLLKYKWEKYGRWFFYPDFLSAMLMTLLYVVMGYVLPKVDSTLVDNIRGCPIYLNATQLQNETIVAYYQANGQTNNVQLPAAGVSIQYVNMVFAIVRILQELICLILTRHLRWSQFNFYLMLLHKSVIIASLMPIGYFPCTVNWRMIYPAFFVSFHEMALFITFFETVGVYFAMFAEVLKSLFKVALLLVFYCVTFGLVFAILMPSTTGFRLGEVLPLSALSYTMGTFDFIADVVARDSAPFTVDLHLTYLIFIFLMPVALANLLIGVAIEDIGKIRDRAFVDLIRRKVNFLYALDFAMFKSVQRKRWYTRTYQVQPNAKPSTRWGKFKAKLGIKDSLSVVEKAESKTDLEIEKVQEEINAIRSKVDQLCDAQVLTMGMLRQMCTQMDITLAEDVNEDKLFRTPVSSRMDML